MPKLTGLEVCKIVREKGIQTPVILLTALGDINSKIEAFQAGADDYITKPFSFQEVLARINAVARRTNQANDSIEFDDFILDLNKRKVCSSLGKEIPLSDKEFDLLRYFIKYKGEIISRDDLCKSVWNIDFNPNTNVCDVTVKNLRKKLEELTGKKYIKSIYGEGYSLIAD